MMHMLVSHKVKDYNEWKPFFDGHVPTRKKAGVLGRPDIIFLDDGEHFPV